MLAYHIAALAAGFLLEMMSGAPSWLPRPMFLIENLVSFLKNHVFLRRAYGIRAGGYEARVHAAPPYFLKEVYPSPAEPGEALEILAGQVMSGLIFALVGGGSWFLLYYGYHAAPWTGFAMETFIIWRILGTRETDQAKDSVSDKLAKGDLFGARSILSKITRQDTFSLSIAAIARMAVEKDAEDIAYYSVGCIFFCVFTGPVGGLLYRTLLILHDEAGSQLPECAFFGRFINFLHRIVNFMVVRLAALLFLVMIFLLHFDATNALRVFRRDHENTGNLNDGFMVSLAAGALDIQLGGRIQVGTAVMRRPSFGDPIRAVSYRDLEKVQRLRKACSLLCMMVGIFLLLLLLTSMKALGIG